MRSLYTIRTALFNALLGNLQQHDPSFSGVKEISEALLEMNSPYDVLNEIQTNGFLLLEQVGGVEVPNNALEIVINFQVHVLYRFKDGESVEVFDKMIYNRQTEQSYNSPKLAGLLDWFWYQTTQGLEPTELGAQIQRPQNFSRGIQTLTNRGRKEFYHEAFFNLPVKIGQ